MLCAPTRMLLTPYSLITLPPMRKTKIVATIGPQTCQYDSLLKLVEQGMNVVRLNFSHGTHEWHGNVIKHIRTINTKQGLSVAIMLDTKGPEVRSGDLQAPILLKSGDPIVFTIREAEPHAHRFTTVSYDAFVHDVAVDNVILIDGGMMSFKVKEISEFDVICETIDGGTLTTRRHMNVRGKSAQLPSITDKDWEDIKFGIAEGIDSIALSFVKDPESVLELKKFLKDNNHHVQVIAKIESAAAIPHLRQILEVSDGAMVARGDLGSELPIEEVPLIQSEMVEISMQLGKPVIVATHLLESMIEFPTPTRAEISDVTVAVQQKADAIMLSGETANGKFPYRAVEVMDRVARRMESEFLKDNRIWVKASDHPKEELVLGACIMANNLLAKAILVFTRHGLMARLTSRCRPNPPIFAFTNTTYIRRQLNFLWGVHPVRIDFSKDPEKTIQRAIEHLKEKSVLEKGDRVVIVSDIVAGEEYVDAIQVREIR